MSLASSTKSTSSKERNLSEERLSEEFHNEESSIDADQPRNSGSFSSIASSGRITPKPSKSESSDEALDKTKDIWNRSVSEYLRRTGSNGTESTERPYEVRSENDTSTRSIDKLSKLRKKNSKLSSPKVSVEILSRELKADEHPDNLFPPNIHMNISVQNVYDKSEIYPEEYPRKPETISSEGNIFTDFNKSYNPPEENPKESVVTRDNCSERSLHQTNKSFKTSSRKSLTSSEETYKKSSSTPSSSAKSAIKLSAATILTISPPSKQPLDGKYVNRPTFRLNSRPSMLSNIGLTKSDVKSNKNRFVDSSHKPINLSDNKTNLIDKSMGDSESSEDESSSLTLVSSIKSTPGSKNLIDNTVISIEKYFGTSKKMLEKREKDNELSDPQNSNDTDLKLYEDPEQIPSTFENQNLIVATTSLIDNDKQMLKESIKNCIITSLSDDSSTGSDINECSNKKSSKHSKKSSKDNIKSSKLSGSNRNELVNSFCEKIEGTNQLEEIQKKRSSRNYIDDFMSASEAAQLDIRKPTRVGSAKNNFSAEMFENSPRSCSIEDPLQLMSEKLLIQQNTSNRSSKSSLSHGIVENFIKGNKNPQKEKSKCHRKYNFKTDYQYENWNTRSMRELLSASEIKNIYSCESPLKTLRSSLISGTLDEEEFELASENNSKFEATLSSKTSLPSSLLGKAHKEEFELNNVDPNMYNSPSYSAIGKTGKKEFEQLYENADLYNLASSSKTSRNSSVLKNVCKEEKGLTNVDTNKHNSTYSLKISKKSSGFSKTRKKELETVDGKRFFSEDTSRTSSRLEKTDKEELESSIENANTHKRLSSLKTSRKSSVLAKTRRKNPEFVVGNSVSSAKTSRSSSQLKKTHKEELEFSIKDENTQNRSFSLKTSRKSSELAKTQKEVFQLFGENRGFSPKIFRTSGRIKKNDKEELGHKNLNPNTQDRSSSSNTSKNLSVLAETQKKVHDLVGETGSSRTTSRISLRPEKTDEEELDSSNDNVESHNNTYSLKASRKSSVLAETQKQELELDDGDTSSSWLTTATNSSRLKKAYKEEYGPTNENSNTQNRSSLSNTSKNLSVLDKTRKKVLELVDEKDSSPRTSRTSSRLKKIDKEELKPSIDDANLHNTSSSLMSSRKSSVLAETAKELVDENGGFSPKTSETSSRPRKIDKEELGPTYENTKTQKLSSSSSSSGNLSVLARIRKNVIQLVDVTAPSPTTSKTSSRQMITYDEEDEFANMNTGVINPTCSSDSSEKSSKDKVCLNSENSFPFTNLSSNSALFEKTAKEEFELKRQNANTYGNLSSSTTSNMFLGCLKTYKNKPKEGKTCMGKMLSLIEKLPLPPSSDDSNSRQELAESSIQNAKTQNQDKSSSSEYVDTDNGALENDIMDGSHIEAISHQIFPIHVNFDLEDRHKVTSKPHHRYRRPTGGRPDRESALLELEAPIIKGAREKKISKGSERYLKDYKINLKQNKIKVNILERYSSMESIFDLSYTNKKESVRNSMRFIRDNLYFLGKKVTKHARAFRNTVDKLDRHRGRRAVQKTKEKYHLSQEGYKTFRDLHTEGIKVFPERINKSGICEKPEQQKHFEGLLFLRILQVLKKFRNFYKKIQKRRTLDPILKYLLIALKRGLKRKKGEFRNAQKNKRSSFINNEETILDKGFRKECKDLKRSKYCVKNIYKTRTKNNKNTSNNLETKYKISGDITVWLEKQILKIIRDLSVDHCDEVKDQKFFSKLERIIERMTENSRKKIKRKIKEELNAKDYLRFKQELKFRIFTKRSTTADKLKRSNIIQDSSEGREGSVQKDGQIKSKKLMRHKLNSVVYEEPTMYNALSRTILETMEMIRELKVKEKLMKKMGKDTRRDFSSFLKRRMKSKKKPKKRYLKGLLTYPYMDRDRVSHGLSLERELAQNRLGSLETRAFAYSDPSKHEPTSRWEKIVAGKVANLRVGNVYSSMNRYKFPYRGHYLFNAKGEVARASCVLKMARCCIIIITKYALWDSPIIRKFDKLYSSLKASIEGRCEVLTLSLDRDEVEWVLSMLYRPGNANWWYVNFRSTLKWYLMMRYSPTKLPSIFAMDQYGFRTSLDVIGDLETFGDKALHKWTRSSTMLLPTSILANFDELEKKTTRMYEVDLDDFDSGRPKREEWEQMLDFDKRGPKVIKFSE